MQINSCNILTTFLPVSGDLHGSSLDLESRLNHQYSPKVKTFDINSLQPVLYVQNAY
ncbi:Uncharacterized protein APZ42_011875 [Daphnia magna]|uniref:Uncharacterized protein n=1 Tax=Daphnia magna TaxID=35525 RepID=A0A162SFB4_9CRUS|nr:Uncharacterized protein APZ42_011875 [Daphnia magna]